MTAPRYAYLGPSGTFTEAALRAMVDPAEIEATPVIDVPAALSAVRGGDADFAVVAIENTVEGGVTATLDTLAEGSPLAILGEVVLAVSFELVARPGTALEDITAVAAHSHGLNQCRRWLAQRLPGAAQIPASSNAAAARELATGDAPFDAALAPPGVGVSLGLEVLASGVADNPHAATRFVKVGRPAAVPSATGADKTTLVVHLPDDRAGALLSMLEQFAARGVNLSRIESRPRSDRPGEYSFSIDALGHIDEPRMAEALVGLKRTNPTVIFLGSYPAATGYPTPVAPGTSEQEFADARSWVQGLRAGRR
ncbi:prephenate dehydratase [Demequina sp. SYSU T00039]|uniref:Prephenate dehydratase n=1 Tax=Demequina lignilytica TaxID=3051663 RepID=A0AAW7M0B9_9MICO|nr:MULTISPECIES: prephenate dehydratase [unclassified Demequina]MDN4477700.1 prephenate dehydratase [Demequina sp. SYSU T00039-1]MDN4487609.1 prephenate dehydratase [Demequina sp. SYSU T00039]MDN4491320.1 prephenate dehydratase [Demequina sp. SYSU T00068]